MTVDTSEAEQILAIDRTFLDLSGQNLDDVRHPDTKKRSLRVVEVGPHSEYG